MSGDPIYTSSEPAEPIKPYTELTRGPQINNFLDGIDETSQERLDKLRWSASYPADYDKAPEISFNPDESTFSYLDPTTGMKESRTTDLQGIKDFIKTFPLVIFVDHSIGAEKEPQPATLGAILDYVEQLPSVERQVESENVTRGEIWRTLQALQRRHPVFEDDVDWQVVSVEGRQELRLHAKSISEHTLDLYVKGPSGVPVLLARVNNWPHDKVEILVPKMEAGKPVTKLEPAKSEVELEELPDGKKVIKTIVPDDSYGNAGDSRFMRASEASRLGYKNARGGGEQLAFYESAELVPVGFGDPQIQEIHDLVMNP